MIKEIYSNKLVTFLDADILECAVIGKFDLEHYNML